MAESKREGTTIWLPFKSDRDKINKQRRKGETVRDVLHRKGVL